MKEGRFAPGRSIRTPARQARSRRPAPRTGEDDSPRIMQREPQNLLNALLADEFVIYVECLNCHWNVRGMQFHSLHVFFETLYREQAEIIDALAEKVRSLGGIALASLQGYLASARIRERTGDLPDPRAMIARLAQDHRAVIALLHETFRRIEDRYDDPSTSNFLADLLEKHEKTTWMLQAHLDRELG
jgi:starvation-inducible DNA-binding protein